MKVGTGWSYYILAGLIASVTLIVAITIQSKRFNRAFPKCWVAVLFAFMLSGHVIGVLLRSAIPSISGVWVCIVVALILFKKWKNEAKKGQSADPGRAQGGSLTVGH